MKKHYLTNILTMFYFFHWFYKLLQFLKVLTIHKDFCQFWQFLTMWTLFGNFWHCWQFLTIFDNLTIMTILTILIFVDHFTKILQFRTILDKDNPRDLWHLRTWIHDNLCDLKIKSDTGQHSQFLRCLVPQIVLTPKLSTRQWVCDCTTGLSNTILS